VKRYRDLSVRIRGGFTGAPRNKTQLWWLENGANAGEEEAVLEVQKMDTEVTSLSTKVVRRHECSRSYERAQ
jgi:hypothetical protein